MPAVEAEFVSIRHFGAILPEFNLVAKSYSLVSEQGQGSESILDARNSLVEECGGFTRAIDEIVSNAKELGEGSRSRGSGAGGGSLGSDSSTGEEALVAGRWNATGKCEYAQDRLRDRFSQRAL
jgi:mevalonate kinase